MTYVQNSSQVSVDPLGGSTAAQNIAQNSSGSLGTRTILTEKDLEKIASNRLKIVIFHIKNIVYIIKVAIYSSRSDFQRTIKADKKNFLTYKTELIGIVILKNPTTQAHFNELLQQLTTLQQTTKSPYIKRYIQNIQEKLNGYQVEERDELSVTQDGASEHESTSSLTSEIDDQKQQPLATPISDDSFIIHASSDMDGLTRGKAQATPFIPYPRYAMTPREEKAPASPNDEFIAGAAFATPSKETVDQTLSYATDVASAGSSNQRLLTAVSLPDPISYRHPYFVDDFASNLNYQHLTDEKRAELKGPKWTNAKRIQLATLQSLKMWKEEILMTYEVFVGSGKALKSTLQEQALSVPTPTKPSPSNRGAASQASGSTSTLPPLPPSGKSAKKWRSTDPKLIEHRPLSHSNCLAASAATAELEHRATKNALQHLLFPLHPNLVLMYEDVPSQMENVEVIENTTIIITFQKLIQDITDLENVIMKAKEAPSVTKQKKTLSEAEQQKLDTFKKTTTGLQRAHLAFKSLVEAHNALVTESNECWDKIAALKIVPHNESDDKRQQRTQAICEANATYTRCQQKMEQQVNRAGLSYKEQYDLALSERQKHVKLAQELLNTSEPDCSTLIDTLIEQCKSIRKVHKAQVVQHAHQEGEVTAGPSTAPASPVASPIASGHKPNGRR